MTLMAGGLGGTFTNSGIIDSTVVSPVAAAGNVVILADTMSLGAGSINAKTGGAAGTVVSGRLPPRPRSRSARLHRPEA